VIDNWKVWSEPGWTVIDAGALGVTAPDAASLPKRNSGTMSYVIGEAP
jgi:hypothetical protein